jgi:hypothetical protein
MSNLEPALFCYGLPDDPIIRAVFIADGIVLTDNEAIADIQYRHVPIYDPDGSRIGAGKDHVMVFYKDCVILDEPERVFARRDVSSLRQCIDSQIKRIDQMLKHKKQTKKIDG